jgi:endonuclease/exonuclease/phosphatase family metal-dependent hydrolase
MRLVRPALILCLSLLAATASAADARELVVVQANVGNVNLNCNDQVFKLCLRPVEQRAAAALRELSPDVVAFQEILPVDPFDLCAEAPSPNPANLCAAPRATGLQATRLLGPGYRVACDTRFGWECLAVKEGVLDVAGSLATRPVLPACEDRGFTLNSATIRVEGWPVTVTVGHPDSRDAECRRDQVRDLFEGAVPAEVPTLVMGDWNLDPFREDDVSVEYWNASVASRFAYASTQELTFFPLAPSQLDPTGEVRDPEPANPGGARTIDLVLAAGGVGGTCRVQRIDGGGGMDHRAQVCRVSTDASVTPALRIARRGCTLSAGFTPEPPHLRGVRFQAGQRTVVDRRAPFRLRLVGAERGRRVPLTTTALLANGEGPPLSRSLPACAAQAPARPRDGDGRRGPARRRPSFTG